MSKNNAYRIPTDEEKDKSGCAADYDLLVGPNGFECFLGEPEDRTWYRDAAPVVEELNRLQSFLAAAKAENERLRNWVKDIAVAGKVGTFFPPMLSRNDAGEFFEVSPRMQEEAEEILASLSPAEKEE